MSLARFVVTGVLKPDGSLEITEPLNLPPGRARVTVEALNEPLPGAEDWFEFLTRARRERELARAKFRSKDEIDAELDAARDEWDRP